MIGYAGITYSMISNMNQRDHDNFYLITSRVPFWDLCMDSDTFSMLMWIMSIWMGNFLGFPGSDLGDYHGPALAGWI